MSFWNSSGGTSARCWCSAAARERARPPWSITRLGQRRSSGSLPSPGVESEINLPYGAVHQLLIPFLLLIDELPVPQRQALRVALGLQAGPPPERFLSGSRA